MTATHSEGRQFTRIELPMQSPQEVSRVVSAGNRRARERSRDESEQQKYERMLSKIAKVEKASAPADTMFTPSDKDIARETAKRTKKEVVAGTAKATKVSKDKKSTDYATLTGKAQTRLETAQKVFESAPPGNVRESARATVGRALQRGVPGPSITRLACQTPNCGNSINIAQGADVVCPSCMSGGDRAGAEYKDRPDRAVTSNTLGNRRNRGSGGKG